MKKVMMSGLLSVSVMILISGCGQSVAEVSSSTQFNECADINKKLMQVDEYIIKVERTSAFHLEEAALALENPKISTSNRKKNMLRDADRKKKKLLADSQKYGCTPYKKK